MDKEFTEQCCLTGGDYQIICKDSYGDGWHGGYLEINGQRYCEDFTIGKEQKVTISISSALSGIIRSSASTGESSSIIINVINNKHYTSYYIVKIFHNIH